MENKIKARSISPNTMRILRGIINNPMISDTQLLKKVSGTPITKEGLLSIIKQLKIWGFNIKWLIGIRNGLKVRFYWIEKA